MAQEQGGETPKKEPESGPMTQVRPLAFWYLLMIVIMLWIWQDAFRQVSLRTIAYSEFKARLARGEVIECTIEQDEITGAGDTEARDDRGAARQGGGRGDGAVPLPERPHRGPQTGRGSPESGGRVQRDAAGNPVAIPLGLVATDRRRRSSGGCWHAGSGPRARASWASVGVGRD